MTPLSTSIIAGFTLLLGIVGYLLKNILSEVKETRIKVDDACEDITVIKTKLDGANLLCDTKHQTVDHRLEKVETKVGL